MLLDPDSYGSVIRRLFLGFLLVGILCTSTSHADDAPVIPLPPEIAKDLELFGKGVVGRALPAEPIEDVHEIANLGSGVWEYEIVHGGDDGDKVKRESYERLPDEKGAEVWKRTVGTEFVEYVRIDSEHRFGKHLEDDLEVGYSSRFNPGMVWLSKTPAGKTRKIESKIEAFKTGKPDHTSYSGTVKAELEYVGTYEVTTPAGTWPAVLARMAFDIEIGPADVTDTTYMFFAKGVGKIAEIEVTNVSALLVYHSHAKVAKVLTKYPKR